MFDGPTRPAHSAFACVCTTAFGRDVVPDVNMIPAGSIGSGARVGAASGSSNRSSNATNRPPCASVDAGSPPSSAVTAIHCRRGPAEATSGAYRGWVTAATQSACSTKYVISASTLRVFVVTPTAPMVAHAYQARTISGQLSAWKDLVVLADTARGESGRQRTDVTAELRVRPGARRPVTRLPHEHAVVGSLGRPVVQQPGDVPTGELERSSGLRVDVRHGRSSVIRERVSGQMYAGGLRSRPPAAGRREPGADRRTKMRRQIGSFAALVTAVALLAAACSYVPPPAGTAPLR